MAKRRKKKGPAYTLKRIGGLIRNNKYYVGEQALKDALDHFGWKKRDIASAFTQLRHSHYFKTDWHKFKPQVKVDFYKAPGLKGENVYTHFYVDPTSGVLVIQSLKRIRKTRRKR